MVTIQLKRFLSAGILILVLCSLAQAAGPTFANGFTANGPAALNQGTTIKGTIFVSSIADPSAPSVTVNTTGAASHTYYLVGHDGAAACGSGNEGHSGTSAGTVASNSASPANNSITVPSVFPFYDVLEDATNKSLATCVAAGSVVSDTGQGTSAYTNLGASTEGQINGATLGSTTFASPTFSGTTTASALNATSIVGSTSVKSPFFATNAVNPAASGLLRDVNNSTTVAGRNAANGADIAISGTDASNNIVAGDATNGNNFNVQNPVSLVEGGVPAGVAGRDVVWGDSASHAIKANPNNSGSVFIGAFSSVPALNTVPKIGSSPPGAMLASSIIDDGTFANFSEPLSLTEQAAPSGAAGKSRCWADSTAHTVSCNFNNAGAGSLAQRSGAWVNGDCVDVAISGSLITFTDAGSSCAGTASPSSWISQSPSVAGSATNYMAFGQSYQTSSITSEPLANSMIPYAATLKNLFCSWANSPANNIAITLRKNHLGVESSTALTCNVSGGNNCNDTTHTVTVAAGDLLDLQVVTGISAITGVIQCAFND